MTVRSRICALLLTAIALGLCPAAQAQTDTGGFSTGIGAPADAIPINVSTLDELTRAVTNNAHRIVINGHIYGGPKLKTLTFSDNSWDNTTIESAPSGTPSWKTFSSNFPGRN